MAKAGTPPLSQPSGSIREDSNTASSYLARLSCPLLLLRVRLRLRLCEAGLLLRLLPDPLRLPASRSELLPRLLLGPDCCRLPCSDPCLLPCSESCLLLRRLLGGSSAAAAARPSSLLLRRRLGPSSQGWPRASAAVARSLGSNASMGSRNSARSRAWGARAARTAGTDA